MRAARNSNRLVPYAPSPAVSAPLPPPPAARRARAELRNRRAPARPKPGSTTRLLTRRYVITGNGWMMWPDHPYPHFEGSQPRFPLLACPQNEDTLWYPSNSLYMYRLLHYPTPMISCSTPPCPSDSPRTPQADRCWRKLR
eukprot:414937-Hanusia_phi.AAC.4